MSISRTSLGTDVRKTPVHCRPITILIKPSETEGAAAASEMFGMTWQRSFEKMPAFTNQREEANTIAMHHRNHASTINSVSIMNPFEMVELSEQPRNFK